MKLWLIAATLTLSACGRPTQADDQASPSPSPLPVQPPRPAWSLTVGEPNEHCPGAFDRSVAAWQNEADVRALSATIMRLPKPTKQAACRVGSFTISTEDFFAIGYAGGPDTEGLSAVGFHPALFRLRPSISQLLTWKDRQVVESDQKLRFDASHAPMRLTFSQDDFAAALDYVVVHELGHVVTVQPEWFEAADRICAGDCDAHSWQADGNLKPDRSFAWNDSICFYDSCLQDIPVGDLPQVYRDLGDSDFTSLYAAQNAAEDLAEAYAATIVFDAWGWQWATEVGGQVVFDNAAHWKGPRMAAKRDLFLELARTEMPTPQ